MGVGHVGVGRTMWAWVTWDGKRLHRLEHAGVRIGAASHRSARGVRRDINGPPKYCSSSRSCEKYVSK